jgi:hypothetical protein
LNKEEEATLVILREWNTRAHFIPFSLLRLICPIDGWLAGWLAGSLAASNYNYNFIPSPHLIPA